MNTYAYIDMMLAVIAVIGIINAVAAVVMYVFKGIGLSSVGRSIGLKTFWLAWIPGASGWFTGSLADLYNKKLGRRDLKLRVWTFVFWLLLSACLVMLSIAFSKYISEFTVLSSELKNPDWAIGYFVRIYAWLLVCSVISCGFKAFYYSDIYRIYSMLMPKRKKLLMFFLSVGIPYIVPFVYFSLRNAEPIELARAEGEYRE